MAPPLDPYPASTPLVPHPFDQQHTVDTSGYLRGDHLHTRAGEALPLHGPALWSTAYYGIAPSIFNRALELTAEAVREQTPTSDIAPLSRFTFVDLGCGKGRALLLATRHPFRSILGVELDPTLARIAQSNLLSFTAPWQQCQERTVLNADAATVDLPLTPILLFLYNPFLGPVLRRVLRRLERSLRRHPRELWLVYVNPEAAHVLNDFPRFAEHTRVLLHVTPEDALADRLGVNTEEVSLFRYRPLP